MAEIKWSREQKQAIYAREGTVLVSAAAGSGKTAVLSQRVMEMLSVDEQGNYVEADRLLIVSFSNAAANEMKERIAAKLDEELAQNPTSIHLQRQKILLQSAQICTMHSFCGKLVRENFHILGISPDFRIADDNEINLLSEAAAQQVAEEYYIKADEGFLRLAKILAGKREDTRLTETVKSFALFAESSPFPTQCIENLRELYRGDGSVWREAAKQLAGAIVKNAFSLVEKANDIAERDENVRHKYRAILPPLMEKKQRIEALHGDYDSLLCELSDYSIKGKERNKGVDERIMAHIDGLLELFDKLMQTAKEVMCCEISEQEKDLEYLRPAMEALCDMTRDYLSLMTRLKKEKNVLHFGDLEHLAVELLVENRSDGLYRTEVALNISRQFDEILLDEYQDTSAVQDMIFRAVAHEDGKRINHGESNLFIVGDVKQSIYRFRRAVSALFTDRFDRYTDFDEETPEYPARITLTQNYRSRKEVTDTVNFIFRRLMTPQCGGVDYTGQQLDPRASYPDGENRQSELHILEVVNDEDEYKTETTEARFIAAKIKAMLDEKYEVYDKNKGCMRPVVPRDFCILRSQVKGHHGAVMARELEKLGIGCLLSDETGFLERSEIETALSFLRIIDNPLQEIALLNVLCSPMVGFNADDLANIRLALPKGNFYNALCTAAESGNEKCRGFLKLLSELRNMAATSSADRVISEMLRSTGYLGAVCALPDGEMRRANLEMLISYAESCEKSGNRGIGAFIEFIDRTVRQNGDMPPAAMSMKNADAVRMMTIHKSKGLEFPVCIVCGLGASQTHRRSDVQFSQKYGGGIRRISDNGMGLVETLPRAVINASDNMEEIAEDVRRLYVALTRAKEKLIMVAAYRNPEKMINRASLMADSDGTLNPYAMLCRRDYGTWITACALAHRDGAELRERIGMDESFASDSDGLFEIKLYSRNEQERTAEIYSETAEATAQPEDELLSEIEKRLSWEYDGAKLEGVPSKVTASGLHSFYADKAITASKPAFLDKEGISATHRGTVLHRFMEKADCKAAAQDVNAEINRLSEMGVFTPEELKVLDVKQLFEFFDGEGGSLMRRAEKILREQTFSAILPKEYHYLFTDKDTDEQIIIEGACDCVLEFENTIAIIDYKSDRLYNADRFIEAYGDQLRLYAAAMEQVMEKSVERLAIWSFTMARFIEIPR